MKYALLIVAEPASAGERGALNFAQALIKAGHTLERVFFYGAAVATASSLQQPPQGETPLQNHWQALAQKHQTELIVCIAAALRRGIIDAREAQRYNLPAHNLAEHFLLSGLGQLVEASVSADRLITFG
ncbi:sulfurtransferase complex subunit TusD [Simiduia sp. 21SJ11W-1]|uniref:sulfurtransferase complex subunit TusD n=1 Tax=Simiduia sp. 21SJ11W-1 TaxID=2909669 RepID=UPI00209D9F5A|nr:sulfurtransferase complex subunit TusD [Simiduia sp. 21SJ11W-1]UTA46352.1 sulfurtransferase complex subunit TusD [Simiduia sp. 21SJ11W-1]